MPSLTTNLLAILGLSALVSSSPVANTDLIEARDEWQPTAATLTCLYMTNEANWGGEGINLCEVGSYCASKLPDGLTGNVSSAGPEAGVTCFLFSEEDCKGERSAPLVNPGCGDLKAIEFEKRARSWKCWKWCGFMGPESSSSASISATATMAGVSMMGTVTGSVGPTLAARDVSITTTIDMDDVQTSAPAAQSITTTVPSPATSSATTSSLTSSATSIDPTSQAQIFRTSLTTIVFTHTYADGSTTVVSSPLAIPIPVSSTGPEAAGGAVSITSTTDTETLEAPTPFSTPEPIGVRITTTLAAEESTQATTTSAVGVAITATAGTVKTLTSEGITVPLPTSVSPPAVSSSSSSSVAEAVDVEGWTSLVTLTGVDATLTVTATGEPEVRPRLRR